jgi:hypothetical protein
MSPKLSYRGATIVVKKIGTGVKRSQRARRVAKRRSPAVRSTISDSPGIAAASAMTERLQLSFHPFCSFGVA